MCRTTWVTLLTFGAFAGIAGLEHGIGELLQGNHVPSGRQNQGKRRTA